MGTVPCRHPRQRRGHTLNSGAKPIGIPYRMAGCNSYYSGRASGVSIQGVSLNIDGTLSPAAAYTLSLTGSQFRCNVPALSAILIKVA